jgi:hypothetical protein
MSTDLTWSDSPIHNELAAWELLKEARRERDEARAESIRWQSIAEGRGRTDDEEEQLAAVTAQRDRLADALKEIEWSNDSQWQADRAKAALQSLTPNEL